MKNLPKEKRDRLILIGVGAFILVVGVYFGVIRVQRQTIEDLAKKHGEEDRRVANGQRLAATTAEIHKKFAAAQSRLKSIESTMASGDMYSWIILTMNSFKENGNYKVEIPQFSREVPSDVGLLPKFPYRAAVFHVRGTAFYHDLGRFIADFENTFPYMRIQNIELEPATTSISTAVNSSPDDPAAKDKEKLSFKMEIVTLVNPNSR